MGSRVRERASRKMHAEGPSRNQRETMVTNVWSTIVLKEILATKVSNIMDYIVSVNLLPLEINLTMF